MHGLTRANTLAAIPAAFRIENWSTLERAGYQVLEAANGVEALLLWQERHASVQLLFTDLVMPEGISGRELVNRLQTQDSKLRVVFTSGVQKPSSPQKILETIRRCLDH